MKTREKILTALGLVFIFGALGVVGEADYQEAIRQEQEYQAMVCDGHWPNYKRIDVNCGRSHADNLLQP